MKKLLFSLPVISLVLVSILSCNQQGSGEAYTLKMRLAKGDSFRQELDMDMDMSFEMMGQKITMDMGIKSSNDFEVLADSANLKNIMMTYRKSEMKMDMKGMPGAENMDMNEIMNETGRKLEGKQVIIRLNDKNEIVDAEGMEAVIWGDSTETPEVREQMKQMFSKEQMNNMFGMMFNIYPDKPVKVGDTWTRQLQTGFSNVKMTMDMKYKLKSVKDGIAYIDVDGDIKTKGTMKSGPADIEMEMKGGQKGQMNVSIADGYLKDGQYTMDIDAEMGMQGMKVPMKIKGNYLVKGKQ